MSLLALGHNAAIVLTGFCIATAALMAVAILSRPRRAATPGPAEEIAFLFDGGKLVDATAPARRLLAASPLPGSDMQGIVAFLAPRFPDLEQSVTACGENDTVCLLSAEGDARLTLKSDGGRLHILLEDLLDEAADPPDRFSVAALTDTLRALARTADACPAAMWRQDATGRVVWANAAYLDLVGDLTGGRADGRTVFRRTVFTGLDLTAMRPGSAQRLPLTLPGSRDPRWFDCHIEAAGDEVTVTALPTDRIVAAERSLRDFVQTLTRTFAHLSVGLAIFDRSRALTIFNPALSDLMGLPPKFLISHPTLSQVLDYLRDRQKMPEPKDYKSWRAQMHALEVAAADGTFSETWPMPDGRMIRVTGRPHPDGALAFLFEDISAEITATRQYRAELAIEQAVIDGLDEAIAVFSPTGRMTLSNRSYAQLWKIAEPDGGAGESFLNATRRWQARCAPTPVWGDARDFAASFGERSNWTAEVRLSDGRGLACRFETLPGGATLAAFQPVAAQIAAPVAAPVATPTVAQTPAEPRRIASQVSA